MAYLYTPPTWRYVTQLEGLLRYGFPVSTLVYRQSGVWNNILTPGIDNPVVANVDKDAASGLLLFFDRPTQVPDSLFAELSAVTPADPSWTPGSLIHL